jgi:ATP-dependent DNA helicase RecG
MSDDPLQKPVQFLKGVGPDRALLLKKLGIETVGDLLWYLPRELLDLTAVRKPRDLKENEDQTVRGTVVDMDGRETSLGKSLVAGVLDCGGEYVRGAWFNQPWMLQRLRIGDRVLWSGKPKKRQGRWEFSHPRIQWIEADDDSSTGGLLPKYPLTDGLSMEEMRRMTRQAVADAVEQVPEHLPAEFLAEQKLVRLRAALRQVHQPTSRAEYDAGRLRILFDDLFEFQLGLALRKRARGTDGAAPVLPMTAKIDARIRRLFPFRLTPGQDRAVKELAADLASGRPMHRLLQADVGAGKTVIAIYAMLTAIAAGYQAVLMAPTELLALQHWDTIDEILRQSRVERAVLTGSLTVAQRRQTLERIASGEIQLVIGTQAVIQSGVRFAKLGLAVIDEQHKFGVAQRAKFSAGGELPHVLVMTATPIPRSLCLTQFGDLDLTLVPDQPPGRQTVVTSRIAGAGPRKKAWDFIRRQLKSGRQAYVVCPRIEAKQTDERRSSSSADWEDAPEWDDLSVAEAVARDTSNGSGAIAMHRELSEGELNGFRVGLAHGRMDRAERAEVMRQFRDGELDVLVATTVVEVGVDVPNATLMVILESERFGLSQLHQLRGRVARGKHQGYCFLFSESGGAEAASRLAALEQSASGFEIAEKDFELRGPGDVLGTRQHGESPLRVASLTRDADLLVRAREAAFALAGDGRLDEPEFAPLKLRVLERFGKLFELPQSG